MARRQTRDPNITAHDLRVDSRNGHKAKGSTWKGHRKKTSSRRTGRRDPNITAHDISVDRHNGHMAAGWENR